MPLDLGTLVAPGHTAVLTVEVQNGVVGDAGAMPALADAVAAAATLERIAAVLHAARRAHVPVVHCTVGARDDRFGSNRNARLFAASRKAGSPPPGFYDLHPAIGAQAGDVVLPRLHGLSPMTGTSLDAVLRNEGITTIVATGVSVNVALLGLAFEGVNRGYQVVLPRDATAGVDEKYVDAVYANTLSLIATVTTTAALVDVWTDGGTFRGDR
jgi:nicotinamidase-related amidase